MSIKVIFDKEIHSYKGEMHRFSELLAYITKSFRQLPKTFNLYYRDAEDDQITLSCEEDFAALLESSKTPKIFIQRSQPDGELVSLEELK
jgi:sequestosome 1